VILLPLCHTRSVRPPRLESIARHTFRCDMNGIASGAVWREASDPKSKRPYYYNTQTNETVWNRPDALLTPAQLATGWAETSAADGRPYWFNKEDRSKTSWSPPEGWNTAPAIQAEQPE